MILKVAVIFCYIAVVCFSSANSTQELNSCQLDFSTKLNNGLNSLESTGKTNKDLQEALNRMRIETYTGYYPEEHTDPKIACHGCKTIVDFLIKLRKNGMDITVMHKLLVNMCQTANIQSKNVCEGFVNMNLETVLYIIDERPNLTGKYACSILLQNIFCEAKRTPWSIDIHPKKKQNKSGFTLENQCKPLSVLHITDIHFDPYYTVGSNAVCEDRIMCCSPSSGPLEKPEHGAHAWADLRACDIPLDTVQETFKHINNTHKDLDFVYFTGDIIAHRDWDTTIGNNSNDLTTIYNEFYNAFGDKIPVYPILGNHEPYPLNVWAYDGVDGRKTNVQWMYDLLAELWSKWLPESTKETILKGGYYTVLAKPGLRIIALNSNVAYTFNWWLLYDDVDPYGQLQWMENLLYKAEKNKEMVHILSHVPTGEDTCYIPWANQFNRIIQRYHHIIKGIFNGHTHYEEFLIYYDVETATKPISVAHNAGSLTSMGGLNPNYRVMSVDSNDYDVLDYETWTFNVTEANETPDQPPSYFKLYSFKEDYGVDDLSPKSFDKIAKRMVTTKPELLEQFSTFTTRGVSTDCDKACLEKNICRIVRTNFEDIRRCDYLKSMMRF